MLEIIVKTTVLFLRNGNLSRVLSERERVRVCNVEEALGVGYIRVCEWEASAEGEERER